jgi:hypothetical protein
MGFKKPLDADNIAQQIRWAGHSCSSPYTDGFNGWYIKQDLYKLKEVLDDALKHCPNFGTIEADWLHEEEQKKIINILKR